MKVMRCDLPGSPGETRIGFVDLVANTAGAVSTNPIQTLDKSPAPTYYSPNP